MEYKDMILFWQISFRVRKRFPTLDHLIELGILRPDELKIMDQLNEKALVKKWWMPLVWATHIVENARRYLLNFEIDPILNITFKLRKILSYTYNIVIVSFLCPISVKTESTTIQEYKQFWARFATFAKLSRNFNIMIQYQCPVSYPHMTMPTKRIV